MEASEYLAGLGRYTESAIDFGQNPLAYENMFNSLNSNTGKLCLFAVLCLGTISACVYITHKEDLAKIYNSIQTRVPEWLK